jgi:hypothetical protein
VRRRGALLAGAAACLLAPQAPAAVALPWPTQPVTASPPLTPATVTTFANRFRGHVDATATVRVGLDRNGAARTVSVTQRLVVGGPGDYVLTIPAPAVSVVRGPGSESQPGLRRNALVWQGFSPGRRVLTALVELDPAASRPALPLAVRLSVGAGHSVLTIENRTETVVASFRGTGSPGAVERYLRALRGFPLEARSRPVHFAEVEGIEPGRRTVVAPFRVRGTAVFPGGGSTAIDEVLGGGFPARAELELAGSGRPRLRLRVEPVLPDRLLRAAKTLDAAVEAGLAESLARQYESFLANPDPAGRSRTTYLYVTAPPSPVVLPASERESGGPWRTIVVLVLLVAATGAGVVVWSRS